METIDLTDPKWEPMWMLGNALVIALESPCFEEVGEHCTYNTPWGAVHIDFSEITK